jgi:hypothetical protein
MLIYLVKCSVALLALWVVQFFHLIPWSGITSLLCGVVVPIGLILITWRSAARRGGQRAVTDYRRLRQAAARRILSSDQVTPDEREVGR